MSTSQKASDHPATQEAKASMHEVFKSNGLLDQAKEAQASGGLADFFKGLWDKLSPTVVPVVIALIQSLLSHIVTPQPAPTPAPPK